MVLEKVYFAYQESKRERERHFYRETATGSLSKLRVPLWIRAVQERKNKI